MLKTLLPLIAALLAPAAHAGGTIIGNGGSSIVCFSIPVHEAYRNHRITAQGARHMTAAYTLEYYRARLKVSKPRDFDAIFTNGKYTDVIAAILGRLEASPGFRDEVLFRMAELGPIEDGIRSSDGLDPIPDSGLLLHLPKNCRQLQAVARRNGLFTYDGVIFDQMRKQDHGAQAAILELHEAIYDIGVERGQTTSIPTQDLLVYLMTTAYKEQNVPSKLDELGFTGPGVTFCVPPRTATPSPGAVQTVNGPFFDDFSGYVRGACLLDGLSFGPWTSIYGGYGVSVVQLDGGASALSETTQAPASASETHTALVLGPKTEGDLRLAVSLKTTRQLRRGDSPNPWEVGWIVWNYVDADHFYYLLLKPNGWELGKHDPTYPGSQRFLATSSDQKFPIGTWYSVRIQQTGGEIHIQVDGKDLAHFNDTENPYTSGRIGLSTQDAQAFFTSVSVNGMWDAPLPKE